MQTVSIRACSAENIEVAPTDGAPCAIGEIQRGDRGWSRSMHPASCSAKLEGVKSVRAPRSRSVLRHVATVDGRQRICLEVAITVSPRNVSFPVSRSRSPTSRWLARIAPISVTGASLAPLAARSVSSLFAVSHPFNVSSHRLDKLAYSRVVHYRRLLSR